MWFILSSSFEKEVKKILLKYFDKLGYTINENERLPMGINVDLIAKKGDKIYLIEIKKRTISNFDIINQSTISTYLKSDPKYEYSEIKNILITGGEISIDASNLANSSGVVLTTKSTIEKEPQSLIEN